MTSLCFFDLVKMPLLSFGMKHVKAVIMRYDTHLGKYGGQPRSGGLRSTLCISSQWLVAKWATNSVQLEAWDLKTIYLQEKLWNNRCMPLTYHRYAMLSSWYFFPCDNFFMIAASPQTCPANIGKGCGDDREGEFFPGIPKIKYEALPNQQTVDYSSFKLVIVGDGGTGKTTIVKRHLTGEFEKMYKHKYSWSKLIAGSPDGYLGLVDGKPREARMNHSKGITVDHRGNIYIAYTLNMAIKKISDAGKGLSLL